MTDLCVFLPTRRRPEMAARCTASFRETKTLDTTDLILVIDDDDDSYEDVTGFDKITVTRETLITAVNAAASVLAEHYGALFLAADDLVFITPGWDQIMLRALADLGGTGIVMPDGKRRYDVPEHPLISSDFIKELGHFAEPSLRHYYCVVPETRVLTASLDWVPIGKLTVGDEIVGVDEWPRNPRASRTYRRAKVLATQRRMAHCVKVEIEDGREITCSVDHPWLAKRRWTGKGQQGPGSFEWRESLLLRSGDLLISPFRVWERETSFEAGWLSGILDGEGCVSGRANVPYPTPSLTVGQNPGLVLDRIEATLAAMDISFKRQKNHAGNRGGKKYDCIVLQVRPRSQAIELLGRLQPLRLQASRLWENMSNQPRKVLYGVVKSVTPVEDSEVVSMKTSTGTYIAEGLVSHNCDNVWAELGKRTGLIRYCPEAVIEHRHYTVDPSTPHDEVYREAEETHGAADLAAFRQWQAGAAALEVARLRRRFSRDVSWVISRLNAS